MNSQTLRMSSTICKNTLRKNTLWKIHFGPQCQQYQLKKCQECTASESLKTNLLTCFQTPTLPIFLLNWTILRRIICCRLWTQLFAWGRDARDAYASLKKHLIPKSLRRLPIAIPPGPAPTTMTWKPSGAEGGVLFKIPKMRRQEMQKAPAAISHPSITNR